MKGAPNQMKTFKWLLVSTPPCLCTFMFIYMDSNTANEGHCCCFFQLNSSNFKFIIGKTGAEIKPGDSSDETDILSNKGLIAGNCFLCRPILKPLFTCLYTSSYLVIHPVWNCSFILMNFIHVWRVTVMSRISHTPTHFSAISYSKKK